ncbi:MAG: hypothetical protein LW832_09610 [Parachlamydia sp.]|jgi:hypothetical protein|nr:hypothetical protein [Parachlamydia sp.]
MNNTQASPSELSIVAGWGLAINTCLTIANSSSLQASAWKAGFVAGIILSTVYNALPVERESAKGAALLAFGYVNPLAILFVQTLRSFTTRLGCGALPIDWEYVSFLTGFSVGYSTSTMLSNAYRHHKTSHLQPG